MTTPGVSKLVQQVADFHKVFQANWRQVANAKAHEKLRITNDMIHLIDEKPQPFVGFLMKGDLDVVSRLMSTMRHVSKLLGTTLPLHFHRFMAQVKDAIGEREDDQVGEDFRIDAISNDLDDLLTKDPAGELKARSSLCQNPSQLRQFLSSHGPRVLVLKKSDCQPVVRTLVQIAKGFATEDEDVLDLLRFLRRACAPPTTPGIARECRAFADWCQKRGVVGADGEKALRGLRKAAEAAADELRAAPRPAVAVNEGLRRKLLANTYVCTSERDLARHFPQVRRGVQSGEVGDYVDVLCTALARKTQSLTAPATPLFRDVHEFVCQTYAASDAAPPDEVRAFMERLKREPRPVPGAQRKRARAEAVPRGAQERAGDKAAPPAAKKGRAAAVPQRAGDKAAPPAGKKGRAAAVPPAARPTERRSKVRKAAGARAGAGPAGCDPQAATLRKVAAAKRKEVRPVPAPTQMYWAEGSLDLRKIVKWSMRKKVYDDIFEI